MFLVKVCQLNKRCSLSPSIGTVFCKTYNNARKKLCISSHNYYIAYTKDNNNYVVRTIIE